MVKIMFDNKGFACCTDFITVHSYDETTKEYLGTYDTQVVVGTTIPAHSCLEPLPILSNNQSAIWNTGSHQWEVIANYRGLTVYEKSTGKETVVSQLGPIAETYTAQAPDCEYPVWDEQHSQWVTNVQAKKSALTTEANAIFNTLVGYALAGNISDENKKRLEAWSLYKQSLDKIDVTATNIAWPTKPE